MTVNRRLFLQSLGLAAVTLLPIRRALCEGPALTVGIFPRRNVATTYRIYTPLLRHLGERLGRPVRMVTAKDFAAFWRILKNQQFDIVHFNQFHYMLAHELYGYDAIVRNNEFGESTIAGSLVVRKDSGIDRVEDLKGKHILFGGGHRAMQSYIAPRWLLQQAGLEPGDYTERFALNPPNAVISTYLGQSDAAGIGDVVIRLESVKKSIDVSHMKYLARTTPAAHLPWAVHPRLELETRHELQLVMQDLSDDPGGQAILDQARVTGFVPTIDSDYDPLRHIVRDVYGDDLGLEKWQ